MAMTVKLKRAPEVEDAPTAAETAAATEPGTPAGPVLTAYAAAPAPSYTAAAICGLIGVLLFLALLLMQWMEWSYYHQPPTAFPKPAALSVPAPEAAPLPAAEEPAPQP